MQRLPSLCLVVGLLCSSLPAAGAAQPTETELLSEDIAVGTVPQGAQGVRFLQIGIDATCARATVLRSLTVRHTGLGAAQDLRGVYALRLYDDGRAERLTPAVSFSGRNNEATLRFRSVRIEPCHEYWITVAADLSPDAAPDGQHGIRGVSLETDAGTRAIPAPAHPGTVRIGAGASAGSVTVSYAQLPSPLRYGAGRTVARIRIKENGGKDVELTRLTLTNDGSAKGADLQNLYAETAGGKRLSATVRALADAAGDATAALVFDPPLRIGRGNETLLVIKGDVRASRSRTVRLIVEEPGDAVVRRAR